MPVHTSANVLQFSTSSKGKAQGNSPVEAIKRAQPIEREKSKSGLDFADVLSRSVTSTTNKKVASTDKAAASAADSTDGNKQKNSKLLDLVGKNLPHEDLIKQKDVTNNDLLNLQESESILDLEGLNIGEIELNELLNGKFDSTEIFKTDLTKNSEILNADFITKNKAGDLNVEMGQSNEKSTSGLFNTSEYKNGQVNVGQVNVGQVSIGQIGLGINSSAFINDKSFIQQNKIAAEIDQTQLSKISDEVSFNQTKSNEEKLFDTKAFNLKPDQLGLTTNTNAFEKTQLALDKLNQMEFSDAKGLLQEFKKMSEVDVSFNKMDAANQLTKEQLFKEQLINERGSRDQLLSNKESNDKGSKLNLSLMDLINNKSDNKFANLNQTQSPPQNMQYNELHHSIPMLTKLESSAETQMFKPQLDPMFQQGLNLKADFTPNLAMRIQWMYKQALSSAEIKMDPPELGPLTVKINQHNGETSIVFQATNATTKEMLEDNLAKLKEMLNQQGINLGEALVEQQNQQSKGEQQKSVSSNQSSFANADDSNQEVENVVVATSDKLLDVYS